MSGPTPSTLPSSLWIADRMARGNLELRFENIAVVNAGNFLDEGRGSLDPARQNRHLFVRRAGPEALRYTVLVMRRAPLRGHHLGAITFVAADGFPRSRSGNPSFGGARHQSFDRVFDGYALAAGGQTEFGRSRSEAARTHPFRVELHLGRRSERSNSK